MIDNHPFRARWFRRNLCADCDFPRGEHLSELDRIAPLPDRDRAAKAQSAIQDFLSAPKPERASTTGLTQVRWQVDDGRIFERTGEKRPVQAGDWHWCDGSKREPECIEPGDPRIGEHLCAIWQISEDQTPLQAPEPQTLTTDPLTRLIREIEAISPAILEDERISQSGRAAVLAQLYQAEALRGIERALDSLCTRMVPPEGSQGTGSREIGLIDALRSERRSVCSLCNFGEHAKCKRPLQPDPYLVRCELAEKQCECAVCHRAPTSPTVGLLKHPFAGMTDNHFCTECGAGRLHEVHQTT